MLPLRDQTLMDWAGEQGDAVPTDFVAEVLASHTDPGGAGGSQDINIQVVPLLSGNGVSSRHRSQASTSVLLANDQEVKAVQKPPSRGIAEHQKPQIHLQDATALCCIYGKMVGIDTVLTLGGVLQMVASDNAQYCFAIT